MNDAMAVACHHLPQIRHFVLYAWVRVYIRNRMTLEGGGGDDVRWRVNLCQILVRIYLRIYKGETVYNRYMTKPHSFFFLPGAGHYLLSSCLFIAPSCFSHPLRYIDVKGEITAARHAPITRKYVDAHLYSECIQIR